MQRIRSIVAASAVAVVAAASAFLMGTVPAQAAGTPLPSHVFTPYFEAWTGDSLSALSQQSGAKYLTMAFVQTASKGSCTAYWNGDSTMPIANSTFGADIATVRASGGDVVPSFGGYTADNTGTEIADSCTDVNAIAAVFQKVVTTYNVTRIDLDIEDNSLTNTAGIDRRNKAIKLTEDWAAAQGRTVQFVYTLPTTTHGLADSGLAVLRSAVANNARIDIVNMMTFDYYDNQPHQMANDTKTSAAGLHGQLTQLYPSKSPTQIWNMIGVTEMIGVDDFGPAETFTTADATTVLNWATAQGIAEVSFWALQRDNGGCPGGTANDNCSGIPQTTWQFSQTFAPFTSGGTTPTSGPPTSAPPTSQPPTSQPPTSRPPTSAPPTSRPPTSAPPNQCTAAAWNSASVYNGGALVSYANRTWKAAWWTQGETPGVAAVWQDQGACGPQTSAPPGTCTVAAWVSTRAYNGGSIVSYNTHKYRAKWWTQGETPGTASVWEDQGVCNS
ncbi:glycosyl hydrolase family 18 protein [Longispora sp. K20-0274]|uniref:chitinase n=1 Tax=Longispora sp. K20-0274 TaxID=3088255 RepID=UPI003999FDDE